MRRREFITSVTAAPAALAGGHDALRLLIPRPAAPRSHARWRRPASPLPSRSTRVHDGDHQLGMRGGVAVELQHAANVIRQQRDLDPAALSAQRECHDRLAQIGRRGDEAARLVELA